MLVVRKKDYICMQQSKDNIMKTTGQTLQQVERFLRKVCQKFPNVDDASVLTDIHIRVSQDSGEMVAFDDDDCEITRCVVEQWIECEDENFYGHVEAVLRDVIGKMGDVVDSLGIMQPYSFVLENDEKEFVAELYVADDDTVIIGGDLMGDLNDDLNNFFDKLLKED